MEECRKGRAAGCILFLAKATKLAQGNPSALIEKWSVERTVLHLVPHVLACGTDQWRSFFCPGRERGSIVVMKNVERPKFHPLPINILRIIEHVEAVKEKLCYVDKMPVYLRAFSGQKVE